MTTREEIEKFASESDKPTLRWLFDKYHLESQWKFVATCQHQRYGTQSYETNRVWIPTEEGRVLYANTQRCKTCKHWDNPEGEYGEVPGVGKCKAVVQFWNATEWNDDGDKRSLKPEYAGKLAFVQDRSDYYAVLNTLPDFGCVQHESI